MTVVVQSKRQAIHSRLADKGSAAITANAESGLMPVLAGEAAAYGYEGENRHFVRAFLQGTRPALTFEDGLEVVELLMAAYKSAELRRTVPLPARGLESFKPLVAQGKWRPGKK